MSSKNVSSNSSSLPLETKKDGGKKRDNREDNTCVTGKSKSHDHVATKKRNMERDLPTITKKKLVDDDYFQQGHANEDGGKNETTKDSGSGSDASPSVERQPAWEENMNNVVLLKIRDKIYPFVSKRAGRETEKRHQMKTEAEKKQTEDHQVDSGSDDNGIVIDDSFDGMLYMKNPQPDKEEQNKPINMEKTALKHTEDVVLEQSEVELTNWQIGFVKISSRGWTI